MKMNSLMKDKMTPVMNTKQIRQNGGKEQQTQTKNHKKEGNILGAIENFLSQWSTRDHDVMYCNNTVS